MSASFKAPWIALGVAALAAAAAIASCGTEGGGPTTDAAAPDVSVTVFPAECPATSPAQGEACTQPEGTTCAFGACATYVVCRGGAWVVAPVPEPKNLCPSLVPEQGAPCGACFQDGGACTYGDPTCSDASTNAAIASCRAGAFAVRFVTCVEAGADGSPPSDGAASDATSDAPRD